MHKSALPPLETRQPATFRTRGVAAPFTTPLLAGARVRESKRSGVELVVPNPSGGRGVYVVEWAGVRSLCNPTVHDSVLFGRVTALSRLDPAAVRGAALDVALEGYAGRDAIAAAQSVRGGDHVIRLLTDFLFLASLIEQVEPTGHKMRRLTERTREFDRRAGLVLRHIAPSLGCTAEHLTNGLSAMGEAFAPVGMTADDHGARVPRLIARLQATESDLMRWLARDRGNDIADLGRMVSTSMKVTGANAATVLADTRAVLADPAALLKRWVVRAGDPIDLAARCDWLLDGWERICLLWHMADSLASRRAALLEMALLVPVQPLEINDWIKCSIPPDATDTVCRIFSNNDAWRSGGAALGLIQRNELLRTMSW